ncbi:DUF2283 domain-containing protein [Streptomyces atratus]|nr:DUF2283 domain-containing protein [Streptomyces atratus]
MADVKVTYDKTADAAYVYFTDPQACVYSGQMHPCDPVDRRGRGRLRLFHRIGSGPPRSGRRDARPGAGRRR